MNAATTRTPVRFRNILYITDFSQAAARAIPYVKKIAEHYGSHLVALYMRPPVTNPMLPIGTLPIDIEVADANDEKERSELLNMFAGIPSKVLIEEGTIQTCLTAVMEKNSTDLVVMGTEGRSEPGKLLLGSVAEEIFRSVSCPVLIVGPRAKAPGAEFHQILYATDLSPESQVATPYAVSLAEEFQSRLILLYVVPEQKPEGLVVPVNVEATLDTQLRKLIPTDDAVRCEAEYYLEGGNPAENILRFAECRQTDLIVLAARPEDRISRIAATHLASGTVHKVVSLAECPVLTIRDQG